MKQNNNHQQGFTLIEVLIALIFVAMGVVTVIEVTGQHVNNLSELEDKIRTGGKNDRIDMGGIRWRTRAKIEATDVERVFLLTVEVRDDNHVDRAVYASVTTAITDRL